MEAIVWGWKRLLRFFSFKSQLKYWIFRSIYEFFPPNRSSAQLTPSTLREIYSLILYILYNLASKYFNFNFILHVISKYTTAYSKYLSINIHVKTQSSRYFLYIYVRKVWFFIFISKKKLKKIYHAITIGWQHFFPFSLRFSTIFTRMILFSMLCNTWLEILYILKRVSRSMKLFLINK